ncbi:tRNA (adenosine(37)-N6)-threonylcarbamoyltransferase complex ATPase subunit type 1 TsaE [Cutibacterium sp.]|uniref:tRNA (adenosine(37)-N6)-threonylcarbamoyltransferase complex ATPase subunit type 1 TsaE n=1 Tax=Cutibacterium sp. TaxID=1912221 RepID=UPI0026DD6126|nr:tRNA (adenosine(37)-N6)-threonylcarbamoyltransferase complex ATPase subunit type 1 TsaE [Cutibacterium sp.]MDO4413163.1 tRNA (adenosine(37)-N6)-threonylcarbamoyltransferase complex ATPase subunit type 1 TsaE [Cutibacterium sp.]
MDEQTSPQDVTPQLGVAAAEEAAELACALDLDETTVSTWLTQGIGITARRGAKSVGLAHLVDDGGHAEVTDLVLTTPDDDITAALVRGAEQIATDLESRILVVSCLDGAPSREYHRDGDDWVRALPTRIVVPTTDAMHTFGAALAAELRAGDIVLASGDLGAGKTTLAQGIGLGLGVEGPVISPTFVLARRHAGVNGRPGLVHVDAYRLGSAAELVDLDLDETMDQAVTLIEWGAGIAEDLGRSHLDIDIRRSEDPADETRVVYLEGFGPRWQHVDLSPLSELPLNATCEQSGDNN